MVLFKTARCRVGLNDPVYPKGCPLAAKVQVDDLLPVFEPCFEVRESNGGFLFLADLPGVALKDLEVLLSEDLLIISGEREKEPLDDYDQALLRERAFGTFSRAFPLPCGVDGANAAATFQDGVLRVRLPKTHRDPARQVPISLDAAGAAPRSSPPPQRASCHRSPAPSHPQPS